MRRAILLAFLLLALAILPATAQRGGGARGGGGGARAVGGGRPMAGPARSPGFAPRPAFGARPGGVAIRPNTPLSAGQFGNFGPNGFHHFGNGFNHGRFHNRFRNNVVVWPWWGWGWGGWGWDSDSYSNNYDNYLQQQAAYNQQLSLQGQLQYMQQQLAELRHDQEVQRNYADNQAATQAAPTSSAAPATSKPRDDDPPTTLVFRDGKRMETQNYAIVGNTLWLMADNGHMQKVPLSELDREATLKSNEDRGVDFRVPQQQ